MPKRIDNRIYVFVIFFMVFLDHVFKVLAYEKLAENSPLTIIPHFLDLNLYINPKSFSHLLIKNKEIKTIDEVWASFIDALGIPLLFIIYRLLKLTNFDFYARYIVFGISFIASLLVTLPLSNFLAETYSAPNQKAIILTLLFTKVFMLFTFGFFISNNLLKVITLLISITNISNIISFEYPPFRVVDYLTFFDNNRIINVADLCGFTATLLVYISPVYIVLRHIKENKSN